METIRTYLDNVFAAFPQEPRVLALKAEMLADMEEKYHALKREGKSEHEAVGGVIANFGSMDEITAELGLTQYEAAPKNSIALTRDEAFEFLRMARKSGRWVGAGVWLIISGVAAMLVLESLVSVHAVGVLALLAFIAVAVMMFIVNGARMNRYEHLYEDDDECHVLLDPQTRADLKLESGRYLPRFAAQIAAGVAAILLAAGLSMLFDDLPWAWVTINVWLLSASFTPWFLVIVGGAVFLFITASYKKSAYDVLLGEGEYSYEAKARNKKADRIVGTVAAVWFPAVTAAYLLWSFIADAWHISWILWPVAGVLFGAFAGGISVWYESAGRKA